MSKKLSLEQFRAVAHISKRKAKWLLENGVISCIEPEELFSFLVKEWADVSDMLTTKQAAELTGYNDNTVNNWAAGRKVKYINYYGRNLISKESQAEYLSSLEGQRIARPSRQHQNIIEAYMDRKQNSGMAFSSMSL